MRSHRRLAEKIHLLDRQARESTIFDEDELWDREERLEPPRAKSVEGEERCGAFPPLPHVAERADRSEHEREHPRNGDVFRSSAMVLFIKAKRLRPIQLERRLENHILTPSDRDLYAIHGRSDEREDENAERPPSNSDHVQSDVIEREE